MTKKYKLKGAANRFRKFMIREGVVFEVYDKVRRTGLRERMHTDVIISCGQTHFHFDAEGVYLGLEWDEMDVWEPRVGK